MALKPFNHIIKELALMLAFVFIMLWGFTSRQDFIHADAYGYYDYLPSIFLHKDINRVDKPRNTQPLIYSRIDQNYAYNNLGNLRVNKYSCGTAAFLLPFYLPLQLVRQVLGYVDSGYELPYQVMVLFAAIFWLFIGLVFLRKTLIQLNVESNLIFLVQLSILFATPFTHYAWFDAGFSHVFSFTAVSLFCYFTISFFYQNKSKFILLMGLLMALIILLRPINFLVVFSIPLLVGNANNLTVLFRNIFRYWKSLLFALIIFGITLSLQCFLWYLQTGNFIVYSYQNESFYFDNPQLINSWFSYQKGLFIYTPLLLLFQLLSIWAGVKKNKYFITYYILYFLAISYVFSCWWSWFYGGSYGQRVYLDYLPILILPVSLMHLKIKWPSKLVLGIIITLSILLNLTQTWQHQEYILHWDQMNKEKYWQVFLRTSSPYKGWVWKQKCGEPSTTVTQALSIPNFKSAGNIPDTLMASNAFNFVGIENGDELRLSLYHNFPHELRTEIAIFAKDTITGKTIFWEQKYLLQFCNETPGTYQKGDYWFKPKSLNTIANAKFYLLAYNLQKGDSLQNILIQTIAAPK